MYSPELILCFALIYGFLFSRDESLGVTFILQGAIMLVYTGALALSFFIIEIIIQNRIIRLLFLIKVSKALIKFTHAQFCPSP